MISFYTIYIENSKICNAWQQVGHNHIGRLRAGRSRPRAARPPVPPKRRVPQVPCHQARQARQTAATGQRQLLHHPAVLNVLTTCPYSSLQLSTALGCHNFNILDDLSRVHICRWYCKLWSQTLYIKLCRNLHLWLTYHFVSSCGWQISLPFLEQQGFSVTMDMVWTGNKNLSPFRLSCVGTTPSPETVQCTRLRWASWQQSLAFTSVGLN